MGRCRLMYKTSSRIPYKWFYLTYDLVFYLELFKFS